MPDKSQNITINYKFNTADVDRANQSLNRANQASNNLQAAGAKAGQSIGTGFSQGTRSILSMQNSLVRLKTQIEVSTNPKSTAKLSAEYKKLKAELDQATKSAFGLANAQKSAGQGAQSLTSQFGGLVGAVRAFITAGIVKELVEASIDMAKLAGNVEGVERAFKRAFPNSVAVLTELREATKGTVNDFELMQRTLQATNLGVAVKELPILFEFAAARAQQTGESVDYLVDSIVRGIGRKSPLILDNLGLSAVRLKQKFDGVALASLSVADVTRGVAEIAREELDKMGGYATTSATKVQQLTVSWEALRIALAKRTENGTAWLTSFLTGSLHGLKQLITSNRDLFLEEARRVASSDALRIVQSKEYLSFADNQQKKFDFLQQEINSRVQILGRYNDNIAALKEERKEIEKTNPYDKKLDKLTKQIRAYNDNKIVISATIIALKEYLKAINLVNEAEAAPSSGIIERKKKQIEDLQKAIEKTNNMADLGSTRLNKAGEVIQGKLIVALEIAQAELADLQRGFIEFDEKGFVKKMEDIAKRVQESASALFGVDLEVIAPEIKGEITLPVAEPPDSVYTPDTWERLKDDFIANWGDITAAGIDIQSDQLKSLAEQELNALKERLSGLRDFYDRQQLLAGDNERAKDQLRIKEQRDIEKLNKEIAREEKQVRRKQVIIDIAAGIGKAFATYVWPYSAIVAAVVAAQGASQLAIINRTNYAKGVIGIKGKGSETSDSIPINVSRNESIMTGWETRHAGDVLKEIRAKKLDNKVLRDLKQGRSPVHQQTVDTAGIIKAIKEQKHPDIVKASNIVYEVRQKTEDYKKRIRAASMGL